MREITFTATIAGDKLTVSDLTTTRYGNKPSDLTGWNGTYTKQK